MQTCGACERFGISPAQLGALGQGARQLPALPIPKQVDPRTVMLVVGVAGVVVALSAFFYFTRKGS
jgi:hypothetical protein